MRIAVALGLRLASGSPGQRLRSLLVATASAVGTVLLLVVWTVAFVRLHDQGAYPAEADRLLAAIVASVALPVVVLAGTVGRLSAALRDRRLANLRLLGLSPGRTRVVAATESGAAALLGTAVGLLVVLALRPLLPEPDGLGLNDRVDRAGPGWAAYAVVVLGLPLVTVAVSVLPQRLDAARALARARRSDARRPSPWRALPLLAGVVVCLVTDRAVGSGGDGINGTVELGLFAGIGLVGLGLVAVVPVFVRLLADLLLRLGRGPTTLLAARRMQSQPAGASRVVAALMVGLFLVVGARSVVGAFESTPQYVAAHDALEHPQLSSVYLEDGSGERVDPSAAVAEALSVDGVRAAAAFPVVLAQVGSTPYEDVVEALVISCAQLDSLADGLAGCREGRAQWLGRPFGAEGDAGVRVRARVGGAPSGTATPISPPAGPQDVVTTRQQRAGGFQLSDYSLIVPPTDPAVAPLLPVTDAVVLISTAPGRATFDRLAASDLSFASYVDFEELDFVGTIRAVIWSLAAVILSIGLLTFTIAAIDRALTRRREIVGLRLVGAAPGLLRRAQWLEAALPTALGCALAIAAGLFAGATYLSLDDGGPVLPWRQSLGLMLIAVAASALVATLTVVATNARLTPETIRRE